MRKTGTSKDEFRRRDHVAKLQDSEEWSKFRKLPHANEMWPTALIIAPSSVAMNWQRELETVSWEFIYGTGLDQALMLRNSGATSKSGCTPKVP